MADDFMSASTQQGQVKMTTGNSTTTQQGIPDIEPPEGLSPGAKALWQAMRKFGLGDQAAFDGLLTNRVTFTDDGQAITQDLDAHGNVKEQP